MTLSEASEEHLNDLFLIKSSPNLSDDIKSSGGIPVKKTGVPVRLCGRVYEPCVLVSVRMSHRKPATFYLPLRTKMYLTFIKKTENAVPLRSKEANTVVENVTEEVFKKLQEKVEEVYSFVDDKPSPPPM